jgi:hypothetical protein
MGSTAAARLAGNIRHSRPRRHRGPDRGERRQVEGFHSIELRRHQAANGQRKWNSDRQPDRCLLRKKGDFTHRACPFLNEACRMWTTERLSSSGGLRISPLFATD